ncbi:hypothetical protein QZH41_011888, partial [Actinostola sp. cb2023]
AIAVFAFSTTVGYHGHFEFNINCNGSAQVIKTDFSYSFDTATYYYHCNKTVGKDHVPLGYTSESEYFVFVGVTCFLYVVVVSLYYIFFDNQVRDAASTDIGVCNFVIVDFIVTVVYVIFWFTCSIAWAAGLDGLKDQTSTNIAASKYRMCKAYGANCTPGMEATYGSLNVSVLLGFLNFLIWCFNIWFLFKETPWHSPRGAVPPTGDTDAIKQETPPSAI